MLYDIIMIVLSYCVYFVKHIDYMYLTNKKGVAEDAVKLDTHRNRHT